MASTNALRPLEDVVREYLLMYRKTTEDYILYLSHACACVRDFRLYHSNEVITAKVSVTANKLIEMPDDMIGFNDLLIPIEGRWWSFTQQKDIVNTTTFTGLVEGRDEDEGEGVDIKHSVSDSYGARGAVNDYNYTIDWNARRIFVDGIESDTVVLKYVSSGITVGAETTVPELIVPVIHSYLLWKESYWLPEFTRERDMREKDYNKEVMKTRNFINSLSYDQLRDILLGSNHQSVKR